MKNNLTQYYNQYENRGIDLFLNKTHADLFIKRHKMVRNIRKYLDSHGWIEVETPIMQIVPDGAPMMQYFTIHPLANYKYFLRISPEDFLKRLCKGLKRIYEIGKNLRVEVNDKINLNEFTSLETKAYDLSKEDAMQLVENIVCLSKESVRDDELVRYNDKIIKIDKPFKRLSIETAFKDKGICLNSKHLYIDLYNKLRKIGIKVNKNDKFTLLNEGIKNFIEKSIIQPTFLVDFPYELRTVSTTKDGIANRFELVISGVEIADGAEKETDMSKIRSLYLENIKWKKKKFNFEHGLDEDFFKDMSYCGKYISGFGLGIDRLLMILVEAKNIKDVILFPLDPEIKEKGEKNENYKIFKTKER